MSNWTPDQLQSVLRKNKDLKVEEVLKAQGPVGKALWEAVAGARQTLDSFVQKRPQESPEGESGHISLTITGQIRGGKNNFIVTRQGKHVPKKAWADWRNEKVAEVKRQLPSDWTPITQNSDVVFRYTAGDRRRRDMPAIIDSVWHLLEKGGVVKDDTLLWITESSRVYDKNDPKVVLSITRK